MSVLTPIYLGFSVRIFQILARNSSNNSATLTTLGTWRWRLCTTICNSPSAYLFRSSGSVVKPLITDTFSTPSGNANAPKPAQQAARTDQPRHMPNLRWSRVSSLLINRWVALVWIVWFNWWRSIRRLRLGRGIRCWTEHKDLPRQSGGYNVSIFYSSHEHDQSVYETSGLKRVNPFVAT